MTAEGRKAPLFWVVWALVAATGAGVHAASAETGEAVPEGAAGQAPQAPAESDWVELTPVAGSNAVSVAVTITGTIHANLVWPLGSVHIPIRSTDSRVAWFGGTQPMRVRAVFAPHAQAGRLEGLEAAGGRLHVTNTLSFALDLGRYCGIGLGRVDVTATNLGCVITTRQARARPPAGAAVFASDEHLLTIDQGLLNCAVSGLASRRMQPFTIAFTNTPLRERLGADGGTASLSTIEATGTTNRYRVFVTTPICFASPVPVQAPVDVLVTITGAACWQGVFQRRGHAPREARRGL